MREQVILIRSILNKLVNDGLNSFAADYEVYSFIENHLGIKNIDANVFTHVSQPDRIRLTTSNITQNDIREAQHIAKANYNLIRGVMLNVINERNITVNAAAVEVRAVIQGRPSNYSHKFSDVELLDIDLSYAFTPYHLDALTALIERLGVSADASFQEINHSSEKRILAIPFDISYAQNVAARISLKHMQKNLTVEAISKMFLMNAHGNKTQLSTGDVNTLAQLNEFVVINLFSNDYIARLQRNLRLYNIAQDFEYDYKNLLIRLNNKTVETEKYSLLLETDGWMSCYTRQRCGNLLSQKNIFSAMSSLPRVTPPVVSEEYLTDQLPEFIHANPTFITRIQNSRNNNSSSLAFRMYNTVTQNPVTYAAGLLPLIIIIILINSLKKINLSASYCCFSRKKNSTQHVKLLTKQKRLNSPR